MRTGTILVVSLAAFIAFVVAPAAAQEDAEKAAGIDTSIGASVYKSKCSFCHGENGDGQGPSGKFLKPPPGNFTDEEWIHGGEMEDIIKVIKGGVEGTAMVGFANTLTDEEIKSLAAYVKSFSASEESAEEEEAPEEETE